MDKNNRFKQYTKMLLDMHEDTFWSECGDGKWIYDIRQCALEILMHDPRYHKKNGTFNVSKIVKKLGIDRRTANVWIKDWLIYNDPITMEWKTNEDFNNQYRR